MDPFLDLIRLLRPQATLWSQLACAGQWGISFASRDDLLFSWIADGSCYLLRPARKPLVLHTGDFVLIRTTTPFTLASHPSSKPLDADKVFAASRTLSLRLGRGKTPSAIVHGGRFVFDTANEDLLTGLLPPLIHVAANAQSAARIHLLLNMNAEESRTPGLGSDFVITRLMELLFLDLLRTQPLDATAPRSGLLAGLADRSTAMALRAIHQNLAHAWSVGELARLAGASRSAFSARFAELLGVSPIQYLIHWRMAVAKDELRQGKRSLSEIAFAIGFQSESAFSTAFRKAVGTPPKRYANQFR